MFQCSSWMESVTAGVQKLASEIQILQAQAAVS